MGEPQWELAYLDDPGPWHDNGRDFRCGYCNRMAPSDAGKWVVREPYVGPGQFMAVHRDGCNRLVRWLRRV